MLKIEYLKQMLVIAMILSTITCALIQKIKCCFKSSKRIWLFSLILNLISSYAFCQTFTDISYPNSMWVGIFSFVGADSIYKSLEGKISSHSDLIYRKQIILSEDNIINKEEYLNGKTNISK